MPKIYPEMVEIGRPPRLEPALRLGAAFDAMDCLCRLLNAMLDERFPERVVFPGDLAAKVTEARDAFFEEASFLFDISACRGLKEEPTQSLCDAFALLIDNETVHNVNGGHEPWQMWYTVHFGDARIPTLFDEKYAKAVNPSDDPAIAEMFARARNFLHRIELIIKGEEETASTYILDLMPEAIRLSLEGVATPEKKEAVKNEKAAFERPWMLVTEGYGVYRHRLAKELGLSGRTLTNYEKDGKTSAGTVWPSPLNPGNTLIKKYYDPLKALDALAALPKDFSKHTKVDDIIARLMDGKLSSKIPPTVPKKPKKETEAEELAREMESIGWQKENQTWESSTMTRKDRPE
ncbi:MAG: hypothetical protein LBU64_11945 [Planctomycetota bacterium]|jgi:hypothetical protein|nr:hypothetical protein [Planctomycetota bacterium]